MPPTLIYRPGRAIGIGHLICSWIGYGTLAQRPGARFLSTLAQTVFDPGQEDDGQDEQAFLDQDIAAETAAADSLFAKAAQQISPETPLIIVPRPCPGYTRPQAGSTGFYPSKD